MTSIQNLEQFADMLQEAQKQLVKAAAKGELSLIERDIVLERLRHVYEGVSQLKNESVSITVSVPPVQNVNVEAAKPVDVPPMPKAPEVKAVVPEVVAPAPKQEVANEPVASVTEKVIENEVVLPVEQEAAPVVKEEPVTEIEHKEIKQPAALVQEEKPEVETNPVQQETVGEKYQGTRKFRNEVLYGANGKQDVASKLQNKPITDLAKSIGINDKFFFTKELFGGDSELYGKTIKTLNGFTDINDALIYIGNNFAWDENSEAVARFVDLIRRKLL
ncbi:MAG: hypothetical protein JW783_16115 [Bacteroidales bacterium]|nr:hypothetical protein [Bacteroidales bacterium]MBN2750664.1 hypothetical protein [Bacteroidales bacterium]